jgi:serine/threonine-protein kinase
MFTLLTGHLVHEADTVNKLLLAAMTKPAPRIASVDGTIPPEVAQIVDRALAFDQKDRWPDAGAMRALVRTARARVSSDFVTLAAGPPPPQSALATPIVVAPAPRHSMASSLGPTSGEPRLAGRTKGLLIGGAILGALTVGGVIAGTRGHTVTPGSPSAGVVQPVDPTPAPTAAAPTVTVTPASPEPNASASAEPAAPRPTTAPRASANPLPSRVPRAPAAPRPSVDPFRKW